MDKKINIWRGYQQPPTNYIWIKESFTGDYKGIYAYDGNSWEELDAHLPDPGGDGSVPATDEPFKIYGTDQNGKQVTISYDPNDTENPNAFLLRKDLMWVTL